MKRLTDNQCVTILDKEFEKRFNGKGGSDFYVDKGNEDSYLWRFKIEGEETIMMVDKNNGKLNIIKLRGREND